MKKFIVIVSIMGCLSTGCSETEEQEVTEPTIESAEQEEVVTEQKVEEEVNENPKEIDLTSIFGEVEGTAIFLTSDGQEYSYNAELAGERHSPYSTFKVVSTLMGLEEDIISSKESKMEYDGSIYWYDLWNDNLNLEQAFQHSCVWYYHQVIYEMSQETVQEYLDAIEYGNRDISQWEGNGNNAKEDLNGFWLNSSLEISPREQVYLLKDLFGYASEFSKEDIMLLQELMKIGDGIYGKTGSGSDESWYVGAFTYENENIYFAIFIQGTEVSGVKAKELALTIIEEVRTDDIF